MGCVGTFVSYLGIKSVKPVQGLSCLKLDRKFIHKNLPYIFDWLFLIDRDKSMGDRVAVHNQGILLKKKYLLR